MSGLSSGSALEKYRQIRDITMDDMVHCPYDYKHRIKLRNLSKHVELCREDWLSRCRKFEIEPETLSCRYCHEKHWILEGAYHHLSCSSFGIVIPIPPKSAETLKIEKRREEIEAYALKCFWNYL